jgi:DnaJ domain
MITLVYGVAAVAAFWWLSRQFAQANPTLLAKRVKQAAGAAAFAAAVLMLFRGRIDMAFLLGGAGAWLFGWSGLGLPSFEGRTAKSPGAVSRVRSAMIEMELDHDSGNMDGTVLVGSLTGRRLGTLDEPLLKQLYHECQTSDPDGVRLLEAYFDRRFPRWRENAQGDEHSGSVRDAPPGAMTKQEAYQILGLQPGASLDEIRQAHRTLMKKLHPDQGGSTYLAARVNQAKEILLSRHR